MEVQHEPLLRPSVGGPRAKFAKWLVTKWSSLLVLDQRLIACALGASRRRKKAQLEACLQALAFAPPERIAVLEGTLQARGHMGERC